MTDWSGALARAFQRHLEIGGSGGSAGSHRRIERPSKDNRRVDSGTSLLDPIVAAVPENQSPPTDALRRTTATTAHSEVVLGDTRQQHAHEQSFPELDTSGTTGTTESDHAHTGGDERFEERAAIIEDGAGVPRSWAESFARLDIANRPPEFSEGPWRQLIDDGGQFLDRWANEAARLGWTALDVFGVHPAAPSTTYEAMGLVPLIRGGDVVAIGSDRATIRTQGGTLLTYLRRPQPAAVAVWALVGNAKLSVTEEAGNA
jgi:hypothetical protein